MTRLTALMTTVALCGAGLMAVPATAQAVKDNVISMDLLNGWATEDGTVMAALRFELAPGWKTYWRAPGESGIPPQFDWTGSSNIAGAKIHWPTPTVFVENGLRTIGYKNELILPVEFTPVDRSKPMAVAADVALGVCQDICLPVSISVARDLDQAPNQSGVIKSALADRPVSATAGHLSDLSCAVEPISDGLRVTATMSAPNFGTDGIAVMELPDPDIWVSEATVKHVGSQVVATVDMVPPTAAPFALDRSDIRITLLSSAQAVDVLGCPAAG
jgi:DsbC/DsbD-like thiol-disulfide interchange protein